MATPYDKAEWGEGYWFDQYIDHCEDEDEVPTPEGFDEYMTFLGEEFDQRAAARVPETDGIPW